MDYKTDPYFCCYIQGMDPEAYCKMMEEMAGAPREHGKRQPGERGAYERQPRVGEELSE